MDNKHSHAFSDRKIYVPDAAYPLSNVFSKTAFKEALAKLEKAEAVEAPVFAQAVDTAVNTFGLEVSKFRQAFNLTKGAVQRWIQQQNLPQPTVRPKIAGWMRENL